MPAELAIQFEQMVAFMFMLIILGFTKLCMAELKAKVRYVVRLEQLLKIRKESL